MPPPPKKVANDGILWTPRKVTVRKFLTTDPADWTTQEITAKARGDLAVHESVDHRKGWMLTAAKVGLVIAHVNSAQDAYKIGNVLLQTERAAFAKDSAEAIVTAFSPWVKAWLKACKVAKLYLDPKSYQEGKS